MQVAGLGWSGSLRHRHQAEEEKVPQRECILVTSDVILSRLLILKNRQADDYVAMYDLGVD